MDRPASWIYRRSRNRMLPHLAVGTACLALAVVASADQRGSISYAEMVRRWHLPPAAPLAPTPAQRPPLVLEMINTGERIELWPLRDDGGFSDWDLASAAHALRDQRHDEECAIDPRLLDLAYRLERHFESKAVRVLSAFRLPHGRSNHGKGRALDLVIPGTRDDEVARYARTIGFVGVGLYPRSGFVHLDSRPRSYFWIDTSGPGQRSRIVPILPNIAAASDAKARNRGEAPPSAETDDESDDH